MGVAELFLMNKIQRPFSLSITCLTLGTASVLGLTSTAQAQTCMTVQHDEALIGVGMTWTLTVPCGGTTTLARYHGIWRTLVGGGVESTSTACGTIAGSGWFPSIAAADVAYPAPFTLPSPHFLSAWGNGAGEIGFSGQYRGEILSDGGDSFLDINSLKYHCARQQAIYDISYNSPEGCQAVLTCNWTFSVSCFSGNLNACGGGPVPNGATQIMRLEETFGFNTTNQLHRIHSTNGVMSVAGLAQEAYNYTPLSQATPANCTTSFYDYNGDLMGGATISKSYLLPAGATTIELYHFMNCGDVASDFVPLMGCGDGTCEVNCRFDFDGNCAVDISDLLIFLSMMEAGTIDVNGDGASDIDDLLLMLAAFEYGGCI